MGKKDTPKPPRSRTPESDAFRQYMTTGWADHDRSPATAWPIAPFTATRRQRLLDELAGLPDDALIVIPAGHTKQRSNDTDYPYRPHTAFTYLTGWGSETTPGSVLTVDRSDPDNPWVVYARGPAGRDTDEFYANAETGEFWTGPRPHLEDVAKQLGLTVAPLEQWSEVSDEELGRAIVVDDGDGPFYAELHHRRVAAVGHDKAEELAGFDRLLAQTLSEARFVKDSFEIQQMREAVDATHRGFDDILRTLPDAIGSPRGERIVEGVFHARARREGHDVGYGTIAAAGSHACILHWVKNDGAIAPGDLLLVDAGVELDSLYTADITRTIPVSGSFSPVQKMVYEAVLAAADAAFEVVKPGVAFRTIHDRAMEVIAEHLDAWGLLPVSPDKALSKEGGHHRRYMFHGTSHHLGLDVHDCQRARRELYVDQELQPGMIFTIEPGLYFQPDDTTVGEQFRGIGVRIEDNIVVTEDGAINLSAQIPRTVTDVEAWVARLTR